MPVKSSPAAPSGCCALRMSLASAMERGIASLGFSTWPGAMQVWPALGTLPLMILHTALEKRAAFALVSAVMMAGLLPPSSSAQFNKDFQRV